MTVTQNEILAYISRIQEAAIDPEKWQSVVREGGKFFNSQASVIQYIDKREPVGEIPIIDGYARKDVEFYFKEFVATGRCPRISVIDQVPVGTAFSDAMLIDDNAHTDYYNWHKEVAGTKFTSCVKVFEDDFRVWVMAWNRPRELPMPDEEEIDLLQLFAPHFQRAVEITLTLQDKSIMADGLMQGLTTLGQSVAFLSSDGRASFMNDPMSGLLAKGDLLYTDSLGRLKAHDKLAWSMIQKDLLIVLQGQHLCGMQAPSAGIGLHNRHGQLTHTAVTVPIPDRRHTGLNGADWDAPQAMLMLQEITRVHRADAEKLKLRYDLTEAQAKLAAVLSGGTALKAAAYERDITYGTARAHLLQIFEKTETHRQSDLLVALQNPLLR